MIGHLVPLLPGSFFIAAGLLLLAENFPAVKKILGKLESRYPAFRAAFKRLRRQDGSVKIADVIIIGLIIIGVFSIAGYLIFRQ
ncbi:MAG: hypothetical protein ACHQM6_08345 [Candidatus Kapaibacterium sp.]